MPVIILGAHRCYYRLDGSDERPVLMLSHSLGLDHTQWDPQVAALAPYFQILRYDTLGHGGSDAPAGEYTMDALGRQALELIDAASRLSSWPTARRSPTPTAWKHGGWPCCRAAWPPSRRR